MQSLVINESGECANFWAHKPVNDAHSVMSILSPHAMRTRVPATRVVVALLLRE